MSNKILLIDDGKYVDDLAAFLLQYDCVVTVIKKSKQIWEGIDQVVPDLIIVNEKIAGITICQALRSNTNTQGISIILVSTRREEENIANGLDAGADYYLVKPLRFKEVWARINALLRRNKKLFHQNETLTADDLYLDLIERSVFLREKRLSLSKTEFSLLALLMQKKGQPVSRKEILEKVWRVKSDANEHYVTLYIKYLRALIEDDPSKPRRLITVRGIGYMLED